MAVPAGRRAEPAERPVGGHDLGAGLRQRAGGAARRRSAGAPCRDGACGSPPPGRRSSPSRRRCRSANPSRHHAETCRRRRNRRRPRGWRARCGGGASRRRRRRSATQPAGATQRRPSSARRGSAGASPPPCGEGLGAERRRAHRDENREVRRRRDLHLRPQPIERQPFGERLGLIRPQIAGIAVRQPVEDEIPKNLALRRQQRAIAAAVAVDAIDVERHHILQQRRRIRPGDADDGAIVKRALGMPPPTALGVAPTRFDSLGMPPPEVCKDLVHRNAWARIIVGLLNLLPPRFSSISSSRSSARSPRGSPRSPSCKRLTPRARRPALAASRESR